MPSIRPHYTKTSWLAFLAGSLLFVFPGCRTSTRSGDGAAGTREADAPRFREVTVSAGLDFVHQTGEFGKYFLPEIMGGGAAMFDFDGDGDLDLFFANGTFRPPLEGEAPPTTNRLYRQEANGRFVDATRGSGLEDPGGFGMGAAVGDVNNDGLPDIYLTNFGPDRLFVNKGQGVFVDVTKEAGIDNRRWSTAAAFFDYDQDGWLDLFVANFLDYIPEKHCVEKGLAEDYCGPTQFQPTPDVLYRNRGEDRPSGESVGFVDVTAASGIAEKPGAGLGLLCGDFNRDSRPDIYVANDSHANFLWINQGDGTFRDEAILKGVAYDRVGRGQASMGVATSDLNADDCPDIVITHLAGESNAVYLSKDGYFVDGSVASGMATASMNYTSWGVAFADWDHDGDLDLAIVNGRIARNPVAALPLTPHPFSPYFESNQLLRNTGAGLFAPVVGDDPFLARSEMSRALVVGDIDNDGDLDFLVTNLGGPARLFLNDAPLKGSWLSVRAVDPRHGKRDAYGAWITVRAGGRQWRRHLNPSSSYLSSHDPRVHFGLGTADAIEQIEVVWPDGLKERFPGGSTNEFRVVARGEGERDE